MPIGDTALKTTVIRKIKRPKGFGRWGAYELERDAFGLWLFTPPGSLFRAQVDGAITECEVGQGSRPAGLPVLNLIPLSGWWMASWTDEAEQSFISVEICTPPALVGNEWQFVDLELDPYRGPDGRVVVDDEDEFVVACKERIISPDEASQAHSAAAEIASWLTNGVEPFGQLGWKKLRHAVDRGLAPLSWLPDAVTA